MTAPGQRQPRVEYPAYLAWVRTLPCTITGRRGPSDPAHLRASAPRYGKRYCGKAEKPDDRWVLPLCRELHEEQHSMKELDFWAKYGIADPFALAVALYESRPASLPPPPEPKPRPRRKRKPKADRQRIRTRPMGKSERKIPTRPFQKRRST